MNSEYDVIVVGAGQAGLATSYYLTQHGIKHVVLERNSVGNSWANRWDSFCLVTPNWSIQLPGAVYDGPDPNGFMLRDDFVAYLRRWADSFACPIKLGTTVTQIRSADSGCHTVDTDTGCMKVPVVVVSTSNNQAPRRPTYGENLSRNIVQVDAESYSNSDQLPPGTVLVVGSAQTGCQIVDDLRMAGRRVMLSVGTAGRLPRRYRGHDCVVWLEKLGYFDRTPEMLDSPQHRLRGEPHVSGRDGGRTLDLREFYRDGVRLLGRVSGAAGETMLFTDDLNRNIAAADAFALKFCQDIDAFLEKNRIDAPPHTDEEAIASECSSNQLIPETTFLDLKAEGVSAIVWATGFTYDFSWVSYPVRDDMGYPVTDRGATDVPGLYFMGLNWMVKRKSGLIIGVGNDARYVANHIVNYLEANTKVIDS